MGLKDDLGTICAITIVIGVPAVIIIGVVALITLTVKWIWGA